MSKPIVAILSFRLNVLDGVSREATKWEMAFQQLGFETRMVAGNEAPGVHFIQGMGRDIPRPPLSSSSLARALRDVDVYVVENMFSHAYNADATQEIARQLAGKPVIVRNHDLAWRRESEAERNWRIPTDPAWRHVAINGLDVEMLATRGIRASLMYNTFSPDVTVYPPERIEATRAALGVGDHDVLLVQPTRVVRRKGTHLGVDFARRLVAHVPGRRVTYWVTGNLETATGDDTFNLEFAAMHRGLASHPTLSMIVGDSGTGAVHNVDLAYAASDVVMLPSISEGFGNATIESAMALRPLVINDYPVARELRGHGFAWFGLGHAEHVAKHLAVGRQGGQAPGSDFLELNRSLAETNFSTAHLPTQIAALLNQLELQRIVRRLQPVVKPPAVGL